jgi:hypothetical protein
MLNILHGIRELNCAGNCRRDLTLWHVLTIVNKMNTLIPQQC